MTSAANAKPEKTAVNTPNAWPALLHRLNVSGFVVAATSATRPRPRRSTRTTAPADAASHVNRRVGRVAVSTAASSPVLLRMLAVAVFHQRNPAGPST